MDRLRVLTLNIWNRSGPWEQRLELIRDGLRALRPDLVGLQEVLHMEGAGSQADAIADGLGYHVAYGVALDVGHGLTVGNALLSRWPLGEVRTWQLPLAKADSTRSLVYAPVFAPFGRIPFFNTHLNWELHHGLARQRQVSFIVEQIDALAPPGGPDFPAILVGDFNAEPASDEIRFLSGYTALEGRTVYFADCYLVAGPDFGASRASATFSRRNAYAAELGEPDRRIDYVFVRGPDRKGRGVPLDARVVFDEPQGGVFASDHFGVLAEIGVGKPPTD